MTAPGEHASNLIPALLDALWPAEVPGYVRLWAIADAAAQPRVPFLVRSTMRQACCLYSGRVPPELAEVFPAFLRIAGPSSKRVFIDHLTDARAIP